MGKSCTNCGKPVGPHGAKSYCPTCYTRYRRNGAPVLQTPKAEGGCINCGEVIGPHGAKGYCPTCYYAWRTHGDPAIRKYGHLGPTCSECSEPPVVKGYCTTHYQRWKKWGDPTVSMQQVKGICAFPSCDKPHDSHGYCTSHARQLRQGRDVRELLPRETWAKEASERIAGHVERDAVRLGKPRRYTLDETYFDEISDEHRAYWLGFITADGGITEIATGRPGVLRVELAERDDGHLLKLSAALGSNRPLLYSRTCACASFGSRHLADSLGRLGIRPRKSATVEPWDGPADLMPHFWRGLFDGDGTIFSGKNGWCVGICGSYACVAAFGNWARGLTGSRSRPRLARKDTRCWQWTSQGSEKSQLLAAALYADAAVALERKLLLARELCAIDFAVRRIQRNGRRSAAVRDAWSTGRHPRAMKT